MRLTIYILLLLLSFGCAQQTNEATASIEEESKATEASSEFEATEEVTAINEMSPLEYIILGKLQEIYDLQKIVSDSTLDEEIKLEAKNALNNLLAETETLENIKNGTIANVKLTNDSSHITFELNDQIKEAEIDVKKEVIVIDGESVDNLEITVEEIR